MSKSLNFNIKPHPFGMQMEGRYFTGIEGYRYGFGSHEKDDELIGNSLHLSFGNMGYDPRTGRRWRADPYQNLYAPISPYSFALGSPIMFTDSDGNVVIGSDGKAVTYERGEDGVVKWSENATADVIEIGNAMLSTEYGEKAFNKWQNAETKIHITIDRNTEGVDKMAETRPRILSNDGLGAQNSDGEYVGDVDVIFYDQTIERERANGSKSRFDGASRQEALGAIGTHEVFHNKKKQIRMDFLERKELKQNPKKNLPINSELNFRKEYNDKNPGSNLNFQENLEKYYEAGYKGLDENEKPIKI